MPRGRKPLHSFSETEANIMDRLAKRSKLQANLRLAGEVEYIERGNFTVALVPTKKGIKLGVAKRNPTDHINSQIGKDLAFSRAVHI